MKSITAKQLRDDLEDIVDSVRAGQTFSVSYRSRPAFRIVPNDNKKVRPGSPEAMQNVMKIVAKNKNRKLRAIPANELLKNEYHKHLDEKYGQ